MRTNEGKPTLAMSRRGDPARAALLSDALQHEQRDDDLTHGFHTYPAGLHPRAARDLLAALPDGPVLDPFCGGGTTLVEAMRIGRPAIGRDVSTVALLVATARTMATDGEQRTALRSSARAFASVAREATALPPPALRAIVEPWYARTAAVELWSLRQQIEAAEVSDGVRTLLWACLSSIVVKVSWRRSDTSARRVEHRRPAGTTAILFHKKARELARRLEALAAEMPPGGPVPDVAYGDARDLVVDAPVSAVLTSPPYPGVYDYVPMQDLRHAWLGRGAVATAELGSRRSWRRDPRGAHTRWEADGRRWWAAVSRALMPGGQVVCVIGDGLVHDAVIDAAAPTESAAEGAGLSLVAGVALARPDHARDTHRWEHALWFEKRGPA